jgi:hypothetical protein
MANLIVDRLSLFMAPKKCIHLLPPQKSSIDDAKLLAERPWPEAKRQGDGGKSDRAASSPPQVLPSFGARTPATEAFASFPFSSKWARRRMMEACKGSSVG